MCAPQNFLLGATVLLRSDVRIFTLILSMTLQLTLFLYHTAVHVAEGTSKHTSNRFKNGATRV